MPVYKPEAATYWEMAGSERLEKFGEFAHIDSLAKTYGYSHEQVFKLSWSEVMTFIYYNKEYSYVESVAHDIKLAAEKVES